MEEIAITLSIKEKKIFYAYDCPSHHNTVKQLKWLMALIADPKAMRRILGLVRKVETEVNESGTGLLSPSVHGDGRVPTFQA